MNETFIIPLFGLVVMKTVLLFVGRGCALVESIPFDRRVVGSNPALDAMQEPWASPSLTVAVALRPVNSDTVSIAVIFISILIVLDFYTKNVSSSALQPVLITFCFHCNCSSWTEAYPSDSLRSKRSDLPLFWGFVRNTAAANPCSKLLSG